MCRPPRTPRLDTTRDLRSSFRPSERTRYDTNVHDTIHDTRAPLHDYVRLNDIETPPLKLLLPKLRFGSGSARPLGAPAALLSGGGVDALHVATARRHTPTSRAAFVTSTWWLVT